MDGTIYIISGNWETADSPAGGLQLELYELNAIFGGTNVEPIRLAFDCGLDAAAVRASGKRRVLIIAHSFGARTALLLAAKLRGMGIEVHLILLDPVRWEPSDAWAQLRPGDELGAADYAGQDGAWPFPHAILRMPENVVNCDVFLRSDLIGPIHFRAAWFTGALVAEQIVGNTNHVSIINATNDFCLNASRGIFQEAA
jgi:pimeloyl-ACP methyl ester carboxylesterase